MKILNTYNQQQQQCTNFGAEIKPNLYLRRSVGNIINNGSNEEKSLFLKIWDLIKRDSKMKTFEMKMDVVSFSNKTVRYSFNLDEGNEVLFSGEPFVNPSIFRDLPDSNFLSALKKFIKDHYGDNVYKNTIKAALTLDPKTIAGRLDAINKKIHQ